LIRFNLLDQMFTIVFGGEGIRPKLDHPGDLFVADAFSSRMLKKLAGWSSGAALPPHMAERLRLSGA